MEETEVTGETTDLKSLSHNVASSTPHHEQECELTTLVLTVTDCAVSCKSIYHTLTTVPSNVLEIIVTH